MSRASRAPTLQRVQRERRVVERFALAPTLAPGLLATGCAWILLAGILLAGAARAQTLPEPVQAPQTAPDRSAISLTGTVREVSEQTFTLAYGEGISQGTITVEMEDWAWYEEGPSVQAGDRVTVYGMIDDELYTGRRVEADSIFVEDHATYYHAADLDPHTSDTRFGFPKPVDPDGSFVTVSGRVSAIQDRVLVLDTGSGTMRVDTSHMSYDPTDDRGFQQIDEGDRVSVSGVLDVGFFDRHALRADTLVTLSRDARKRNGDGPEAGASSGG